MGFDTSNLVDVKVLLEELAMSPSQTRYVWRIEYGITYDDPDAGDPVRLNP